MGHMMAPGGVQTAPGTGMANASTSGFGKFRVQGLADHGFRFLRLPLKVLFLSKTYLDGHGT